MRKIEEWLVNSLRSISKSINFIIRLIPAVVWLFIFLELFLFILCGNVRHLELYILQFPVTLWVLTAKKDGK